MENNEKKKKPTAAETIRKTIDKVRDTYNKTGFIVLPGYRDEKFFPAEIIRVLGEKCSSEFFISGRLIRVIVSFRLGVTKQFFETENFIRTHQSHMVNLNHARCYWPCGRGYMILMSDGSKVPVTKTKATKEAFEAEVKSFTHITRLECEPACVPI
jgi:DNA-binding LytR/AlgR family response regulator